ncbi:MAG: CBS domain-containing protein [Clostridia bacterium]|nr:CBS domain-containing protein [Clostridia bacterium]
MFVSNRMVTDVPTLREEQTLAEALNIMDADNWEALPVLAEDGSLLGVLTMEAIVHRLLKERSFEGLAAARVGEAAVRGVAIEAGDIIEEAAFLMKKHDLSALPVVDENGRALGVITERMLYGTFIDMMGLRERGSRITLVVEDRIGALADIAQVVMRNRTSIASLATFVPPDRPRFVQVVLRVRTTTPEKIVEDLRAEGYRVTHVSQVWE